MSGINLPPLWLSPNWTGVGIHWKSGSPRRFPANQALLPPPAVPLTVSGEKEEVGKPQGPRLGQVDPRMASLQRNIQFLQEQHKETLEKLHAEIEYLRKENNELKYKMIMESHQTSRKGRMHSFQDATPKTQGRVAHTEEEPLEKTSALLQDQALRECGDVPLSVRQINGTGITRRITSLQPLRVRSNPSRPPHPPTLQECEIIIQQMFKSNNLQSQEIARLKALLRDFVLSKKIPPENHMSSKAYLIDKPR
ncbi:PREDICTED: uncharacterized protein LOC107090964 [Cyprinodon variegatus]|uniref:uncharacterized protein LOC107090964 n=1 Tax=Cyprinodon variegatus TaxID=28743 RepID=UPI0007426885|nr:PREDICTED: uncharacterized protein LOC107090964 [Cyprinodon variegatus]